MDDSYNRRINHQLNVLNKPLLSCNCDKTLNEKIKLGPITIDTDKLRNLGRDKRDQVNGDKDKKNGNGAQGNGAQSSTTGAQGTQGGNNDNVTVSGAQGGQGAQSSTVTGAQGAQSSTVTGAQGAQGGQGSQNNTVKKCINLLIKII